MEVGFRLMLHFFIMLISQMEPLHGSEFREEISLAESSRNIEEVLPTSLPKGVLEKLQDLKFKDISLQNIIHYEITYPEKLRDLNNDDEDDGVPNRKHERRRRHIEFSKADSAYKIKAFGKSYQVLLRGEEEGRNHWVSVEYHKQDGSVQKKLISTECYKMGDVVDNNSTAFAAISDCNGLTGVIQIPNDFLYIEPLSGQRGNKSVNLAHIIYKLSDVKGYLRNDSVNVIDDFLPAEDGRNMKTRSRKRRDSYDSFVTFVNRAPVEVQLFWVDYRGRKNYFLTLRPNELRGVNTYDNTKWIAFDKSGKVRVLIDNKEEFYSKANDEVERKRIHVTAPPNVVFPEDRSTNEVTGDQKYIEVMVIADHTVTRHHGRQNVEKYVLTFMNIVSRIFEDPSLGVRIKFVVTRIAILERQELSLNIVSDNPSKSVTSACNFATTLQRGNDYHKDHFDIAITLTKKKFGPSGYAPVYSMCTKTRSCALVDDDGFTSAFIAAHETGHTLGLEHDGQGGNDCTYDGAKGSVMSPRVVSRFDRFFWSKCSRNTIKENIEYFRCLNDKPQAVPLRYSTLYPGAYYTLDEQCESNFARGYSMCNAFAQDPCQLLWCNVPGKTYYCKTLRGPALDGSACGTNMWCYRGKCVPSDHPITPKPPTTIPPIHGNWGQWTSWSACSVSCGLGVRHRQRECDYPRPKNGGRPCEGNPKEKDLCNQNECLVVKSHEDSREDQCIKFGGPTWSLYKDEAFQQTLNQKEKTANCTFEDGMCNWVNALEGDDFDWKLNKGKTPSSGTGPDFDHTKGNEQGQYVFIEASDDYKERRRRNDKALLIGPVISVPRTCLSFHYHMFGKDMGELRVHTQVKGEGRMEVLRKQGDQRNRWLHAKVSLEVLKPFRIIIEAVRGRHYTGDLAIDDVTLTSGLCLDQTKARNSCVISCRSHDASEFILDKEVQDGTRCYSNRSSDICIKGSCERFGCDKMFGSNKVVDDCGICGGNGRSCRKIIGQKVVNPKKDFEVVLILMPGVTNFMLQDTRKTPYKLGIKEKNSRGVHLTDHTGGPKGYYRVGSTTFHYQEKDGKQILSTEGPVKKELEAVLYAPEYYRKGGVSAMVDFQYFEQSVALPSYRYILEGFGPCSKSCGIGKRVSALQCLRENDQKILPNKYCSHLPKPVRYQACNLKPCAAKYKWIIMPWGQCSVSCNGGFKSRVVACMRVRGNEVAGNRLCPRPVPSNKEECNTTPCDIYSWKVESWGACSKTCGGGVRRRQVNCVGLKNQENVDPSLCKEKRPDDREPCNIFLCKVFEWTTVNFGVCSKTCGGGTRIRLVYCVNKKSKGRVTPDLCTGPSPPRVDGCNLLPCPEYLWKVGDYGDCSRKCGNGTKTRTVKCTRNSDDKMVDESNCKEKKPNTTQPCYGGMCTKHTWEVGPWSECSADCGHGVKRRTVKCVNDQHGNQASADFCDADKPPPTVACSAEPCTKLAELACNFDDTSKFCKWQNSVDDDFDWQIGQFTPSSGTGPLVDHTTGKGNGRFAYIEASSPQKYGDKATFGSPYLDSLEGCLRFWYHMRGASMGTLFVHLVHAGQNNKIFEKTGDQGKAWKLAEVSIKRTKVVVPYKITFTAYRGQTYASDIAIDDISVKPQLCGQKKIVDQSSGGRKCREVSPLCVLAQTGDYCKYRAFRQLCCRTCEGKS